MDDGALQVEFVGGQVLGAVIRFAETLVLALALAPSSTLKHDITQV